MLITKRTRLIYEYTSYLVKVENRTRIPARKVIITTRVKYRKQPLKNLSRFEGAGVYQGMTFMEGWVCVGEEVIVVVGGNSAGQIAVFIAKTTKRVHMLIRSAGLAESTS